MKSYFSFFLILFFALSFTQNSTAQSFSEDAADVNPVLTGTTIPDATVKTVDGKSVSIKELISQKPTVLIFYRGSWCPYCNKHLAELQQTEQKLVDMGYQILAVSPDRPKMLKESVSKHDLQYTLLSDSPMNLTKAFGLALKLIKVRLNAIKEWELILRKTPAMITIYSLFRPFISLTPMDLSLSNM